MHLWHLESHLIWDLQKISTSQNNKSKHFRDGSHVLLKNDILINHSLQDRGTEDFERFNRRYLLTWLRLSPPRSRSQTRRRPAVTWPSGGPKETLTWWFQSLISSHHCPMQPGNPAPQEPALDSQDLKEIKPGLIKTLLNREHSGIENSIIAIKPMSNDKKNNTWHSNVMLLHSKNKDMCVDAPSKSTHWTGFHGWTNHQN